jgi:hypothetical protein
MYKCLVVAIEMNKKCKGIGALQVAIFFKLVGSAAGTVSEDDPL